MFTKQLELPKIFLVIFTAVFLAACSDGGSDEANGETASGDGETDYPTQSIEVMVPAGAGGDTDLNSRITAKYLEEELGETLVVTNVGGAGGTTGINEFLSKEADGHNVLTYHNAMLVNNVYGISDIAYEDFQYAGMGILDQSNTFLVSSEAEFDDLESFIAYAQENPGEVDVATENGAMTHLQLLEFEQKADVDLNIVDAGGASEKITALLGGRVDVVPTSLGLVQDYLESGEFESLGVIAEERLEGAPDIPTFEEQGVDMSIDKVFYWAFSEDTPQEVVDRFSEALENVVENEDFQEEISNSWLTPTFLDSDETLEKLGEIDEHYREVYENSDE